ncbi:hypothetical protein R1flu_020006 [Riccia fluitans]|uniref:Uncharacterized protein n=1 Tax=Riccia fluitans TaxID=41844 RepID=A0ABD1ZKB0_9MARC
MDGSAHRLNKSQQATLKGQRVQRSSYLLSLRLAGLLRLSYTDSVLSRLPEALASSFQVSRFWSPIRSKHSSHGLRFHTSHLGRHCRSVVALPQTQQLSFSSIESRKLLDGFG